MKVVVLLEAGVPEYRKFLFEELSLNKEISDFIVLHTGRSFSGKGSFKDRKIKFLGSHKLGMHLGFVKYLKNCDVVISSYNLRIITCWLPMFFLRRPKWVLWGKGLGSSESNIVSYLRKITAKKADRILVYNNQKKDEIVSRLTLDPSKVIATNNTIKVSNEGISTPFEAAHFLYFGRIQARKGLIELLYAYKNFLSSVDAKYHKKLRIVGNGDFKERLLKLVNELNIQNEVEFYPGAYNDREIKLHFQNAIAYVSPHNVGLGVVNSFAYGVPVITLEEPQVGPEFNYLNAKNSFVCKDKFEITDVFMTLSTMGISDLQKIKSESYKFYEESLNYMTMVQRFEDAIFL